MIKLADIEYQIYTKLIVIKRKLKILINLVNGEQIKMTPNTFRNNEENEINFYYKLHKKIKLREPTYWTFKPKIILMICSAQSIKLKIQQM